MKICFILSCMLLVVSCARMNYQPRIEKLGALEDTRNIEEEADNMKWAEAANVAVYLGKYPEGISIDNAQKIVVNDKKFTVLAKVFTNYKQPNGVIGTFYDYPEDQLWRKNYCYWQDPLTWVTLGFWRLLSPIYAPCNVYEDNSVTLVNDRKMRIINTLKKATKAVGGDLLIITAMGKLTITNAETKQELSSIDMISAEGYALKSKN